MTPPDPGPPVIALTPGGQPYEKGGCFDAFISAADLGANIPVEYVPE